MLKVSLLNGLFQFNGKYRRNHVDCFIRRKKNRCFPVGFTTYCSAIPMSHSNLCRFVFLFIQDALFHSETKCIARFIFKVRQFPFFSHAGCFGFHHSSALHLLARFFRSRVFIPYQSFLFTLFSPYTLQFINRHAPFPVQVSMKIAILCNVIFVNRSENRAEADKCNGCFSYCTESLSLTISICKSMLSNLCKWNNTNGMVTMVSDCSSMVISSIYLRTLIILGNANCC